MIATSGKIHVNGKFVGEGFITFRHEEVELARGNSTPKPVVMVATLVNVERKILEKLEEERGEL